MSLTRPAPRPRAWPAGSGTTSRPSASRPPRCAPSPPRRTRPCRRRPRRRRSRSRPRGTGRSAPGGREPTAAALRRTLSSSSSSYTISIARPPSTYDGRTTTGYPIRAAILRPRRVVRASPCLAPGFQLAKEPGELTTILGEVDRLRPRPEHGEPAGLESLAIRSGVWPPNCRSRPRPFGLAHRQDVLGRHRLEVEPARACRSPSRPSRGSS